MATPAVVPRTPDLLDRLGGVCRDRGVRPLAARLFALRQWIADDLAQLEDDLTLLPRADSVAHASARHLLDLGGKRLRPMCVALAARLGTGFGPSARHLALAVELIHNASLLHDDVIDLAERRRGVSAARVIYGNAASIIGGNSLLVVALRRVQAARVAGMLTRTLDTIDAMVAAEALQLNNRGRLNPSRDDYFAILDGKTASLFRLALFGGAAAGGLSEDQCRALEGYGTRLGVAFQLVDDLLDFTGDTELTGKGAFNDLREGKMTYPLLLAIERDATLLPAVERVVTHPDESVPSAVRRRVLRVLRASGALRDCRNLARRTAGEAVDALSSIPDGPSRRAFITLAEVVVGRRK